MKLSLEAKVGIFFIGALIVLLVMFEMISGLNFFVKETEFRTAFKGANGLKTGDYVKILGVEAGKVKSIAVKEGKVWVTFALEGEARVHADSIAAVKFTSLLGTNYLDLTFGSPDKPLAQKGAVIASVESPDLNSVLSKLENLSGDINRAFTQVNDIFAENRGKIARTVTNLDSIMEGVAQGKGTLGKLVKDDTLYVQATATMTNLNKISSKIENGQGTIGKLVNDDAFYNDAKTALANFNEITDKINHGQGTLGKLVNEHELYDDLSDSAKSLKSILKKVDTGQGTIGKLVNDDGMYGDIRGALKKVNKVTDSIEEQGPLTVLGIAAKGLF